MFEKSCYIVLIPQNSNKILKRFDRVMKYSEYIYKIYKTSFISSNDRIAAVSVSKAAILKVE
jgi:hypothetical protein